MMDDYSEPYFFGTNRNGGGVHIYIREDISYNMTLKELLQN